MFKWFKKHCKKLIIASSILTACICGLFGFTKSYAYDYDTNNNTLVGNNLFQNKINNVRIVDTSWNDVTSTYSSYIQCSTTGNSIIVTLNGTFNLSTNVYIICDTDVSWVSGMKYYPFGCSINVSADSSRYTPSGFSLFYKNNNNNTYSSMNTISLGSYVLDRVGSTAWFSSYYNNSSYWTGYTMSVALSLSTNWNTGNYHTTFTIVPYMFNNSFDVNYAFSSPITFVPYDSIEELQEAYDELQQQYNDYLASHSYTDTQYNDLVSANAAIQRQYGILSTQYNVYVSSHSHTNEEYNNLLEGYEDLLDTQRELESDYELLQDQYNELLNKYKRYQNPASYGWFTYIDYIQAYNSSYDSGEVSFDDLVADGYVSNYTFLLDDFVNDNIEAEDGTLHVDIVFRDNVVPLNLFEFLFTDMTYSGYLSVKNFYMNTNGSSYTYFFSHNVINVKEFYYMEHGVYPNDEQLELAKAISQYIYVNQISLDSVPLNSDAHDFTIVSNDAVDSYSFNLGFQSGYYNGTLTNNDLKTEINGLNKKINELYTNINTLRNLNNELQEQISNSYGWKSLFFAMADTPLKTVSNVLGFELFGLNLFTTFIGIITVFAIIWILKKFI